MTKENILNKAIKDTHQLYKDNLINKMQYKVLIKHLRKKRTLYRKEVRSFQLSGYTR